MKPQSGLLDTYQSMVFESRARVNNALPAFAGSEPHALTVIRNEWRTAGTALDSIDSLFDNLAEAL